MYIPAAFQITDPSALADFIERFSFATLISTAAGEPFATHLPLVLDRKRNVLLGHFARANPHVSHLENTGQALAIFHGPHAYISPTWYAASPAVPTWNYAVVHAYGSPRLLSDSGLDDVIGRLVHKYESSQPSPWPNQLPDELRNKLYQSIVGFELKITRLEGKFKLGQNRSANDRAGMLAHLDAGDADSRALADFMRNNGVDPRTGQK